MKIILSARAKGIVRHIPSIGGKLLPALALFMGIWSGFAVQIRWVLSSNRIYVSGPGSATLTDIKTSQYAAPLDLLAPGVWHLRSNLLLTDGAQLVLHGTSIGGDVNELRLQSNNTTNDGSFVFINADWGSIHIQSTAITSWDDAAAGPDIEYANFGRAYMEVRSSLADDGVTALESRMDILDSNIGYLGYDNAESYGLTWKVVGTHPAPNKSIFDYVNVYGDILNSHLHHNFFGMYSFGHYGGHWATNESDHNVGYGFDPHDDSDHLIIENNYVHDNGWDGIIASKRCDHLIIRNNVSRANGQNGIILHRNSNDCLVENNQSLDNGTTGIVLTGDWRCIVRSNLVVGNLEAGIRLDLGSADNLIVSNLCVSNLAYGLYLYKSGDIPEPNDDARPKRNLFSNNQVRYNGKDGINLADSDNNTFAFNSFYANGDSMKFVRGFSNYLAGNDIPTGVTVKTFGSIYDNPITYISNQDSLRIQVDPYSSTIFEDETGQIFDTDEKWIGTSITTNGSALTLTATNIGSVTTVIARSLWAHTTNGTAQIDPIGWSNSTSFVRQWQTQAGSPVQTISYTVGSLPPNGLYLVKKAGIPLVTLPSGKNSTVTFTDITGTTNGVLYSIEPKVWMHFQKLTNGVTVYWTQGTLQRATSLSPPNWQDVPITNGQLSLFVQLKESMEYFRSIQTLGTPP